MVGPVAVIQRFVWVTVSTRGYATMKSSLAVAQPPIEAVTERLNDPATAASLLALLDHVDLLSTLVTGLHEFFERGDTIIESLASGAAEIRNARAVEGVKIDIKGAIDQAKAGAALLADALPTLRQALPALTRLVQSGVISDQLIDVLGMVGASAVEGTQHAKAKGTTVMGIRGTMKALKDPEVARGMGLLVEIAKSLGTRLQ